MEILHAILMGALAVVIVAGLILIPTVGVYLLDYLMNPPGVRIFRSYKDQP